VNVLFHWRSEMIDLIKCCCRWYVRWCQLTMLLTRNIFRIELLFCGQTRSQCGNSTRKDKHPVMSHNECFT
jgi:hypothetical protein